MFTQWYVFASSGSSGKIEIGSLDLLDDPTLLEEIVDDVLTSVLEALPGLVSLEELETWAKSIGLESEEPLPNSSSKSSSARDADMDIVGAFTSGKIFSVTWFWRPEVGEISGSVKELELLEKWSITFWRSVLIL